MTRIGRLTASAAPASTSAPHQEVALTLKRRNSRAISEEQLRDTSINVEQTSLEKQSEANGQAPTEYRDHSTGPQSPSLPSPPLAQERDALFRRATSALASDNEISPVIPSRSSTQANTTVQSRLTVGGKAWSLSSISASAPVSKRARREKLITSEEQVTLDRMDKFLARASHTSRQACKRRESTTSTSSSVEEVLSEDIDLDVDDLGRGYEEGDEQDDSRTSIELDHEVEEDSKEETENDDIIVLDEPDSVQVDVARSTPLSDTSTSEISFDLSDLRSRLVAGRQKRKRPSSHTPAISIAKEKDLEEAGIKIQDEDARKALSRLVSKEDFAKMKVVGQFNLAFIIVRRREAIKSVSQEEEGESVKYHDDLMIIE